MKKLLLIILVSELLMGCATMNRPECQNADWRMIGMEDGMNGRLPSYIGRHRSACAKYNVTPDLDQYRQGHEEGLAQFCTEAIGYDMGKRGRQYNGICPPQLEDLFLAGYVRGRDLHSRLNELSRISSQIESDRKQVEKLEKEIRQKEQRLIDDGTSKGDRALLLRDIEDLRDQINELEKKIVWQRKNKDHLELECEHLGQ